MSHPKLPNIVFMHSHNTGTFVQPYGHAVPTPNLQRLAREGVLFRTGIRGGAYVFPQQGGVPLRHVSACLWYAGSGPPWVFYDRLHAAYDPPAQSTGVSDGCIRGRTHRYGYEIGRI